MTNEEIRRVETEVNRRIWENQQVVTEEMDNEARITSYNVCYTKLLRICAVPVPAALVW